MDALDCTAPNPWAVLLTPPEIDPGSLCCWIEFTGLDEAVLAAAVTWPYRDVGVQFRLSGSCKDSIFINENQTKIHAYRLTMWTHYLLLCMEWWPKCIWIASIRTLTHTTKLLLSKFGIQEFDNCGKPLYILAHIEMVILSCSQYLSCLTRACLCSSEDPFAVARSNPHAVESHVLWLVRHSAMPQQHEHGLQFPTNQTT